jgi:hypothetical protein
MNKYLKTYLDVLSKTATDKVTKLNDKATPNPSPSPLPGGKIIKPTVTVKYDSKGLPIGGKPSEADYNGVLATK